MARLQRGLPTYTAAAYGFSIHHGDVGVFTKGILRWLKRHASKVGAWSEAARMAPNSAGAARVFSFLKTLLGSNQDTTLNYYIRRSISYRYSNTKRASKFRTICVVKNLQNY
jgi:hypothetical protein